MATNIHFQKVKVDQQKRIEKLGQKPKLIWFTGLSGSGKSTLANSVEYSLFEMGYKTYLLDGDNIRSGLNKDLSFTKEGRVENIRRIGEVGKLMLDAGLIVISAFISPYRKDRSMVADLIGIDNFLEIFVDCPLEICEKRDVKGLYRKARMGEIKDFTGFDSPYEAPENPFLHIHSDKETLDESLKKVIEKVKIHLA